MRRPVRCVAAKACFCFSASSLQERLAAVVAHDKASGLRECGDHLAAVLSRHLHTRTDSSATRAAASAPAAPQSAASRLADRSGVRAWRLSSSIATVIMTPPTTNGRGQAKHTNSVIRLVCFRFVMTKEGCHESTRITDRSGGDSPQRCGLCTNRTVLRQGQRPAATGRN